MPKLHTVIEVRGGTVQECYGECEHNLLIIDWDNFEEAASPAERDALGLLLDAEQYTAAKVLYGAVVNG